MATETARERQARRRAERRKSEAQRAADDRREVRSEEHVDALERELEGYEARRKGSTDADVNKVLDQRIKDTKASIAEAKKGHGTGPKTRVTNPVGPNPAGPEDADAEPAPAE